MTVEGDSYQGRVAFQFIKITSQCMNVRVSVLINGLSQRVFDVGLNYAFSPRKRQFTTTPKKLPLKEKKVIIDTNSTDMSRSCSASEQICVYVCVYVYAPVFTGVHIFVFASSPLLCLPVHSNYTLYYLISPASKHIWK